MIKTLSEFLIFLKNPSLLKISKNKKSLQKDFLWLLLLNFVIALIIGSIYFTLISYDLIRNYEYPDLIKQFGLIGAFLAVVILAPFLEEFIFRFQLRKRYLSIYFICISVAGICNYILGSTVLTWPIYIIFIIAAFIIHGYFRRISLSKTQIIWNNLYPWIFYFTAVFFGLIHISNLKGLTFADPSFIIYVSSQISIGFTLGYLRIKYGLVYSILFHASFNLIILMLAIIFPS